MNVEQRRRREGKITRSVDLPADLDRRLVHHARRLSMPMDVILRTGAIKACRQLDALERCGTIPTSSTTAQTAAEQ